MQTDNLPSTLQYTHGHVIKVSELQVCFSTLQGMGEEVTFHMFLKKRTPNYLEKEKFRVIMEEEQGPVDFVSKVKEYYHKFLSSN